MCHIIIRSVVINGYVGLRMEHGTALGASLKHHHWQSLACLIADFRKDWPVDDVLAKLAMCAELQSFPDLAQTALTVAMNPACKTPAAILFAASGMLG